jgi:hypothetical protein
LFYKQSNKVLKGTGLGRLSLIFCPTFTAALPTPPEKTSEAGKLILTNPKENSSVLKLAGKVKVFLVDVYCPLISKALRIARAVSVYVAVPSIFDVIKVVSKVIAAFNVK